MTQENSNYDSNYDLLSFHHVPGMVLLVGISLTHSSPHNSLQGHGILPPISETWESGLTVT